MRWLRLLLITVGVVSVLLNAVFAGVATRVWLRSDHGSLTGVVLAMPDEARENLRRSLRQSGSAVSEKRRALQQTRQQLQTLMQDDRPDPDAISQTLAKLRKDTEMLQLEIHSAILDYYLHQETE